MSAIKVLIVDDSPLIREMLQHIFSVDGEFVVVGQAADPYEARELIKHYNPDVLTLDVEMPKMDGITFLRNLMRLRPMPVVMISSVTERGAPATLDALALGAFDYVTKPHADRWQDLDSYAELIRHKVKMASRANMAALEYTKWIPSDVIAEHEGKWKPSLIALGSSTGGTEALRVILTAMPEDCPPVVMVQHIPENFSATFAQRLDRECVMRVKEAEDGDLLSVGQAYLAPGNKHLRLKKHGSDLIVRLDEEPPINGHRPAVDRLFESLLELEGYNITAAILTGMGRDGARGLKDLAQRGANTLVQDEASSIVWGMPSAALMLHTEHRVVTLEKMAAAILDSCTRK